MLGDRLGSHPPLGGSGDEARPERVPREVAFQPSPRRVGLHEGSHGPTRERAPDSPVAIDGPEHAAFGDACRLEPGPHGAHRTRPPLRSRQHGHLLARALLVGLAAADRDEQPSVPLGQVAHLELDQLGPARRHREAEQQQCPVAQRLQVVAGRVRDHGPQLVRGGCGLLPLRGHADRAADAGECRADHLCRRGARQVGRFVRPADRARPLRHGRNRQPPVGQGGEVGGNRFARCGNGNRFPVGAPRGEVLQGRSVGPQCGRGDRSRRVLAGRGQLEGGQGSGFDQCEISGHVGPPWAVAGFR